LVRDLVFVVLVVGFFALAVLFVRACAWLLADRDVPEDAPRP
jgi:hypothetical protein